MKPSIRLWKIGGVEIGLHYSWFAVVPLMWWGLAVGFLPGTFPGWGAGAYWAAGVVAALMLFASALLHELAHSLVAKSRGIPVEGITLFFLGGVSNLKSESRRPRDELIISAVGPLASLALAAVFGVAVLALQDDAAGFGAGLVPRLGRSQERTSGRGGLVCSVRQPASRGVQPAARVPRWMGAGCSGPRSGG